MMGSVLVFVCAFLAVLHLTAAAELGLLAVVSRASSGDYLVHLDIGSPPQPQLLLLDVSQNYIWAHCSPSPGTSSFTPSHSSTFTRVLHNKSPVFVDLPGEGRLQVVADTFTFNVTDGRNVGLSEVAVGGVQFLCSSSGPSPSPGASGVAGLGRGMLSLPSQIAARRNLPRRFAYCLSGVAQLPTPLWLSSSNYTLMPYPAISGLLYTTLAEPGYRLTLEAIKVGDNTTKVNPNVFNGGLEVSTTEPYTKLVRPAYEALRDAFRTAENGIPRVAPVAPFETCFNATGLGSTRVGPPVNTVSFVFKDGTSWPFFGSTSMVLVSEDVLCFGFLDAGPAPAPSILGTYQQIDSLVEIDLDRNRLGFYPTLAFIRTTCANFNFTRVDI